MNPRERGEQAHRLNEAPPFRLPFVPACLRAFVPVFVTFYVLITTDRDRSPLEKLHQPRNRPPRAEQPDRTHDCNRLHISPSPSFHQGSNQQRVKRNTNDGVYEESRKPDPSPRRQYRRLLWRYVVIQFLHARRFPYQPNPRQKMSDAAKRRTQTMIMTRSNNHTHDTRSGGCT